MSLNENEIACPWGKQKVDLGKANLTIKQKLWFIQQIIRKDFSATYLAGKYSLKVNTVLSWVKRYKKNGYLCEKVGRRRRITPKFAQALKDRLRDRKFLANKTDFDEMVHQVALETEQEVDSTIISTGPVGKSVMRRLEAEINVRTGQAEVTTNARQIATSDIYNAVTFYVMNAFLLSIMKVHPALCLNSDATQFQCGGNGDTTVAVKYDENSIGDKGSRSLKTTNSKKKDEGIIKYFVKYYLIISAVGMVSDPIYMLADDNMDEEEFRVYEIAMLGTGHNLKENRGYVVFTKTRAANTKFYKWMNEKVLFPFISDLRKAFATDIAEGGYCEEAWFQLDGEAIQIDIYKSQQVQNILEENKIHVGKPPGSTTAITQPCDAGNCFRGPKATNKHLRDADVMDNHVMLRRLDKMFSQHNEWLNSDERGDLRLHGKKKKTTSKKKKSQSIIEMNPQHVKMARCALLRVQYAIQKSVNQKTVRESFRRVGIFQNTVDFDVIMNNVKSNCAEATRKKIYAELPSLLEKFSIQGELYENDLTAIGIDPNVVRNGMSIDELVLSRRRSCLLTHNELMKRETQKEEKKGGQVIETRKRKRDILDALDVIIIND
jgi:hypothetical protein